MTWEYLAQGAYFDPFFRDWYDLANGLVWYGIPWVILAALLLVALITNPGERQAKVTQNKRPIIRHGTTKPHPIVIAWRALQRLSVIEPVERPSRVERGWILATFLLGLVYGLGLVYISWQPDQALTTGTLQQLSAEDFERVIQFLYHYAFFGFFCTVANLFAAVRLLNYLF